MAISASPKQSILEDRVYLELIERYSPNERLQQSNGSISTGRRDIQKNFFWMEYTLIGAGLYNLLLFGREGLIEISTEFSTGGNDLRSWRIKLDEA